jgi:hypothetical protein
MTAADPGETKTEPPPTFRGRLDRLLRDPVVGAITLLLSVAAIPLSIYLALRQPEHRDLSYFVHPEKTAIVEKMAIAKEGQIPRLSVTLDGKPVVSDVTAAQVAIWNEGNQAIRKEHVLESLQLRTSPSVPIVDATIRKTSRGVVRFELDKANFQRGELGLSWNILEGGDGAILQVVFAGGTETDLVATATLEGQSAIHRIEDRFLPQKYDPSNHMMRTIVTIWLFSIGQLFLFWIVAMANKQRLDRAWPGVSLAVGAIATLIVVALRDHRPPFGF